MLLLYEKVIELLVSGTAKVEAPPLTAKPPDMVVAPVIEAPFAPIVSLSAVVRVPVMLDVPIMLIPPAEFEICPLEFTCVQDKYPIVEVPVTFIPFAEIVNLSDSVNVPVMVEPPVIKAPPDEIVKAPAILEFPVTTKPPDVTVTVYKDDSPVQTIVFVESKLIAIFPKLGPGVRTIANAIGELAI